MFTEERALWLYEHYRWLERHLPSRQDVNSKSLVLPTSAFFPMRNTRDHVFAEAVFAAVRRYMEVSHWVCRLEAQSDHDRLARDAQLANGILGENTYSGAAGTFYGGEDVTITYSPALLSEPVSLVATLAHELCHYLMATVKDEPPCGWDKHEHLTDLAAVHEGFGVFLSNSAFSFNQWSGNQSAGWQWSKQGYLSEAELGFSLGIFCIRSKHDPEHVMRFLKPNPAEVFWDSLDYVGNLEKQWS